VPRREDYFASQVAYELVRCNARHPGRVKRQAFLAPVPHPDRRAERTPKVLDKNRLELSKQVWLFRVQKAGARPPSSSQEKGGGREKGKKSAAPSPQRDAAGKRFEVERVERGEVRGGERA
jgi:hypothetical protein